MTLTLTPASVTSLSVGQSLSLTGLTFTNSTLVHQSGHDAADLPVGTRVWEVDGYGNFLLGRNRLLTSRTGNLLANGYVPDGLMYQQESRQLFVGTGLAVATVGDPPDLILARFGPDNAYPDNSGLGVAGVPSGNSLGSIRFMGACTPNGGTADVTLGAFLQSASATIYARATEDNKQSGSNYYEGGELYFQTTPNNSSTAEDRMQITQDGHVKVLGSGKLLAAGGIGVGNSAAATTPGSCVKKIEVFDASGSSLGFLPVYSSIS